MKGLIFVIVLSPILLMADVNPPRINDTPPATATVTVQVTFVAPPISPEMTEEEIDTTSEGMCSVNPDDPTEIICQQYIPMSRKDKINEMLLKRDLERVLAILRARPLKGKIYCLNCKKEHRAVMSLNQRDALENRRVVCPYCDQRKGLFFDDPWPTK